MLFMLCMWIMLFIGIIMFMIVFMFVFRLSSSSSSSSCSLLLLLLLMLLLLLLLLLVFSRTAITVLDPTQSPASLVVALVIHMLSFLIVCIFRADTRLFAASRGPSASVAAGLSANQFGLPQEMVSKGVVPFETTPYASPNR